MKTRHVQLLLVLTSLAAFAAKWHTHVGHFDGH
jgi:hypothetical protein